MRIIELREHISQVECILEDYYYQKRSVRELKIIKKGNILLQKY